MSYKAVLELFLQIHDFRNIDLPNQGEFKLRVSVYQELGLEKIYATPFEMKEVQTSQRQQHATSDKIKEDDRQKIQPPYYYTKKDNIDEKVQIDENIRFKLQIQSFPRLSSQVIFLEFELMFSQCHYYNLDSIFEQKIVSMKKFKLRNVQKGQIFGYHSSMFSFTIFSCISNFKFGKYKMVEQMKAIGRQDQNGNITYDNIQLGNGQSRKKNIQRSNIKTFNQFMNWVQKYYQTRINQPPLQYFYKHYVKTLRLYSQLAKKLINSKLNILLKHNYKIPKYYLSLDTNNIIQNTQQLQVNQKQFLSYMRDNKPVNITLNNLQIQVNIIHQSIYMMLIQVQRQFQFKKLNTEDMISQFSLYLKSIYQEQVFRSVTRKSVALETNRENKKIVKKIRENSQGKTIVQYPIQDMNFSQSKSLMQIFFYQITNPNPTSFSSKNIQSLNGQFKSKNKKLLNGRNLTLSHSQNNLRFKNDLQIQTKSVTSGDQSIMNQSMAVQKQISFATGNRITSQYERFKKKLNDEHNKLNEQFMINISKVFQFQEIQNIQNIQNKKYNTNLKQVQFNVNVEECNDDRKTFINDQIGQQIDILQQKNLHQIFQRRFGQQDMLRYHAEQNMLIVLCHGYQGTIDDMLIVMRGLKTLIPYAHYLRSKSNENKTRGSIDQMGMRLAKQIQHYIQTYMISQKAIISFVGHSMGGIIARASFKYLSKIYEQNHQYGFYCSLSSPHLGYLNGVQPMIKLGLWLILRFKNIQSLQQLVMRDTNQLKQSFLYKLSNQGSLKLFKKIILLSSLQDSYVTWHSARISPYQNNQKSIFSQLEHQMAQNIVGNSLVHRLDVNFNVNKTKNVDSFIGRAAHINFIDQNSLFKVITTALPKLFDFSQKQ